MSTTDTERDERLPNGVDALIDLLTARTLEVTRLNREVARLDAVVTAVRELHVARVNSTSALHPKPLCSCGDNYPCPTVRALDGVDRQS